MNHDNTVAYYNNLIMSRLHEFSYNTFETWTQLPKGGDTRRASVIARVPNFNGENKGMT